MINIKKILVPTDFSQFSGHAMRYGCEFAKRFNAELHILNVVEDIYPIVPDAGIGTTLAPTYLNDLTASSERAIQNLPSPEEVDGLTIVRTVLSGTPFLEIIRYARDRECDLIVIGTHGRSGLVHVLMGSVSEKVVRKSPCPVLAVRPDGHDFVMP